MLNTDPINLDGMTFADALAAAKGMYMGENALSHVTGLQDLADRLEADALSIARWETNEDGHWRVDACVGCGRLLEFSHHVRAKLANGN